MYEGMGFNCLEIVCEADLSQTNNLNFIVAPQGQLMRHRMGYLISSVFFRYKLPIVYLSYF